MAISTSGVLWAIEGSRDTLVLPPYALRTPHWIDSQRATLSSMAETTSASVNRSTVMALPDSTCSPAAGSVADTTVTTSPIVSAVTEASPVAVSPTVLVKPASQITVNASSISMPTTSGTSTISVLSPQPTPRPTRPTRTTTAISTRSITPPVYHPQPRYPNRFQLSHHALSDPLLDPPPSLQPTNHCTSTPTSSLPLTTPTVLNGRVGVVSGREGPRNLRVQGDRASHCGIAIPRLILTQNRPCDQQVLRSSQLLSGVDQTGGDRPPAVGHRLVTPRALALASKTPTTAWSRSMHHARSPYLRVEDVAERLHVSRRTVHELTRTCGIPHRRLGGHRRCLFVETELAAWEDGAALEVIEQPRGGRIVRPKAA